MDAVETDLFSTGLRRPPQITLALDAETRVLNANRSLAGTRFSRIREGCDACLHEQIHPGCDGSCHFWRLWKKAWAGLDFRDGFEWEVEDPRLGGRLRLNLSRPPTSIRDGTDRRRAYAFLLITDITKYRQEYEQLVEKHEALQLRIAALRSQLPNAGDDPADSLANGSGQESAQNGDLNKKIIAAQETERRRIAADLHDGVVQNLAAIKYGIEARVAGLQAASPVAGIEGFESVIEQISETMEELRDLSRRLSPSVLDEFGICVALEWLCREHSEDIPHLSVSCSTSLDESVISDVVKVAIYRVVQEAFNNIGKYASASHVELRIDLSGDTLTMTIEDDGVGFDVEETTAVPQDCGGFGLRSMRERIEATGGSFSIDSKPQGGTRIAAVWSGFGG